MELFYEKIDSLKFWTPQLFISTIIVSILSRIIFFTKEIDLNQVISFEFLIGVFSVLAITFILTIFLSCLRYIIFFNKEKRPKNIKNESIFFFIVTILVLVLSYLTRTQYNELLALRVVNLSLCELFKYLIVFSAIIHLFYTVLILIDMILINKVKEGLKEYIKIVVIMFLIFAFISYFLLFTFYNAYLMI